MENVHLSYIYQCHGCYRPSDAGAPEAMLVAKVVWYDWSHMLTHLHLGYLNDIFHLQISS